MTVDMIILIVKTQLIFGCVVSKWINVVRCHHLYSKKMNSFFFTNFASKVR